MLVEKEIPKDILSLQNKVTNSDVEKYIEGLWLAEYYSGFGLQTEVVYGRHSIRIITKFSKEVSTFLFILFGFIFLLGVFFILSWWVMEPETFSLAFVVGATLFGSFVLFVFFCWVWFLAVSQNKSVSEFVVRKTKG